MAAAENSTATASSGAPTGVKRIKTQKKEALWLTSFCDLSLILMSFFALMLSMSTMNVKRSDEVMSSIKKAESSGPPRQNLESIMEEIQKEVKKRDMQNAVGVKLDTEGLAIEFKNTLMFSSGSADINKQYTSVTSKLLDIIAASPARYHISIEGHTDDTPVASGPRAPFKSNWELSAQRGIAILNDFRNRKVDENRMDVVAYAATKPKVSTAGKSGDALAEARAANRRVVIRMK